MNFTSFLKLSFQSVISLPIMRKAHKPQALVKRCEDWNYAKICLDQCLPRYPNKLLYVKVIAVSGDLSQPSLPGAERQLAKSSRLSGNSF
jgi:hypothetical protein